MKLEMNGPVCLLVLVTAACAAARTIRTAAAEPPDAKPLARVFLVGDAGEVSFEEAQVTAKTEEAEEKVEQKQPPTPAPPPPPAAAPLPKGWYWWARPQGGEKKVFDEIVNETISLAIGAARKNELLETLKAEAAERDTLAPGSPAPLVLWLGDNVYDRGVPRYPGADGYKDGQLTEVGYAYVQAAASILVQVQIAVDARADAVFVAGNHDWDSALSRGEEGRERAIEEGLVIERWMKTLRDHGKLPAGVDVRMLPRGGCPGPELVRMPIGGSAHVIVAAMDTEWLITEDPNRGCAAGGNCKACYPGTLGKVYETLGKAAREASARDVMIVAAHHPLRTYGVHGGKIFWSPTSWPRWLPLSQQDMAHPRNKAMVRGLKSAWSAENGQPLLYAAGHEHNLQVIKEGADGPFVAVSGSASKISPVRPGDKALFAAAKHGYMVLDAYGDGRVLLRVVEVEKGGKTVRHPPFELRGPANRAR